MDELLVELSAAAERWIREGFPGLSEGAVAYLVPKMNTVGCLVLIPPAQKETLLWAMVHDDADRGNVLAAEILSYKDRGSR